MTHIELWNKQFGKKTRAKDFAGREIRKELYIGVQDKNNEKVSKFSWNMDHIQALANNGKDDDDNLQITNVSTNREKGDANGAFKANGEIFEIRKNKNNEYHTCNTYEYKGTRHYIEKKEIK